MNKIIIFGGYTSLIDEEDFDRLSKYKWHMTANRRYAHTKIYRGFGRTSISMHRLIVNAKDGQIVDHIDGNGLNNQKSNLRFCTVSQNRINSKKYKTNTTGYRGVTYNKKDKRFQSVITFNKKHYYLGGFKTAKEAALSYNKKCLELHGEFAVLNII